jgi:tRNA-specific 2-thiouridylase
MKWYNHVGERNGRRGIGVIVTSGRVVMAMSGGVDSSVSARLLRDAGYDVVGLFMRTGAHVEEETCGVSTGPSHRRRGCCSAVDAQDARRVADQLDIPFYALNFESEFDRIEDYFVDEYLRGRTPNPCVVCNTWLKFGRLFDYADTIGARWIATGHYAQIVERDGDFGLHRGVDDSKDQSYFLFGLERDRLSRILFPVGGMQKRDVRALAEKHRLAVAAKPDSQEVCFIPDGDPSGFISRRRPEQCRGPGEIVDQFGRVVGTHSGLAGHTIGQRRGLGVALGEPRYVLELLPEQNRLVIGPYELLERRELEAEGVNWLSPMPTAPRRCTVKIRYRHVPANAEVEPTAAGRVRVRFDSPQFAVTPGQAAVFYDGPRVLGGGWIC